MKHRHPRLARPIPFAQLVREFRALWRRARVPARPLPSIVIDARMEAIHKRNARRYAEVDVRRRIFHFAPAVLWLPQTHRLGLLAHEIGHVIMDGRGTETDADCAAFDDLDVVIEYDRRWPGRGVQRGRRAR
jgi:hypothetical protein